MNKPAIAILFMYDEDFAEVAALTLPVVQSYADRYGYVLVTVRNPIVERNIQWHRVRVIHDILNGSTAQAVFHCDADVLITNPDIELEYFIEPGMDLGMSREGFPSLALNDGTSIWMSSMKNYMEDIWAAEAPDATSANGVIQKWHNIFPWWRRAGESWCSISTPEGKKIRLYEMPKALFNAYPDDWKPGAFALHLPGHSNEKRCEIFKRVLETGKL